MTNIPDAGKVDVSGAMAEALRSGLIDGLLYVGEPAELAELVVVRPVVDSGGPAWLAELGALLSAHRGSIVGFASADPRLAAEVASAYASWHGDGGRDAVLIDGSLEHPVVDRPLMEDGHEGFVDAVLFGVSAAVVARRTLARGVRVVTAGSRPLSMGRALDPGRLSEFVGALEADVGIIVLPLRFASLVADALDTLVIVETDEEQLLAAAGRAREDGTARIVCVRPVRAVEPEDEVAPAGPPEAPPQRVTSTETTWPVLPPQEEAPEFAERDAPTKSAGATSGAATGEPEPSPFLPEEERAGEPEPSPFLPEEEPLVVVASRTPPPPRRRPRVAAVVVLLVAASVIVWGWLGGGFRGGERPRWSQPWRQADTGWSENGVGEGDEVEHAGSAGAEDVTSTEEVGDTEEGEQARTAGGTEDVPAADVVVIDPSSPLSGPGGPYVIYLSSQRLRTAAALEVDQAREAGLLAHVVDADVPGSGMWHRVALDGGYPNLAEARNTLDSIRELGYEGAWIARVPREE